MKTKFTFKIYSILPKLIKLIFGIDGCHFNINNIKHHLLKINIKTKCPICSNSKMKNLPLRKSSNKTTSIFELVHLDIVGPVQESIHGNKYFLTILDNYSRFCWVYFQKARTILSTNSTFGPMRFIIFSTNQLNIYALTTVKNSTTVILTRSAYLKASFINSLFLITPSRTAALRD